LGPQAGDLAPQLVDLDFQLSQPLAPNRQESDLLASAA